MTTWHLITGEYPPQSGGVSDYCRLVAAALAAAGDDVRVWCPDAAGAPPEDAGVTVRRDLGRQRLADLVRVGRALNGFARPRRLLVQWVPHAFGWRSVNLPFCLWLWGRAMFHGDDVQVVVHEPYLPFGGGWKQSAAAVAQRLMAAVLLRAARRVWVTTPTWQARWQPYTLGRSLPFAWLPVPCTIPPADDPEGVAAVRARLVPPGGCLVGHFGTYGRPIADALLALAPRLLAGSNDRALLLLGRGSDPMRAEMAARHPQLAGRVNAAGDLPPALLSRHLSACDLMVQPYPGGINGRRTSAMAALAHGRAVVTTRGLHTEPVWRESEAVALAPDGDVSALGELAVGVLTDARERGRLAAAGRALYQARFDVRHCVEALRSAVADGG